MDSGYKMTKGGGGSTKGQCNNKEDKHNQQQVTLRKQTTKHLKHLLN